MLVLKAISATAMNSLASLDELLKGSKNISISIKKYTSIVAIEAAGAQQESLAGVKDKSLLEGIEL